MEPNGSPTSRGLEALHRCIAGYRRILELSHEQARVLETGALAELPSVLLRKAEILEQTQDDLKRVKNTSPDERATEAFRTGLAALRRLMAQVIELEERCSRNVPTHHSHPPPARVASAYRQALSPTSTAEKPASGIPRKR